MKSVRSIRVGIETGGTKTLCRVVADNTVLTDGRWATTSPDAIANELTSFIAQACPSGSVLAAAGLAAFGLIVVDPKNSDYGLMLQTSKVGWTGSNLRAVLEHRLGVSVVVETDVSTAALAEQRNGAGLAIASRSLAGALHP